MRRPTERIRGWLVGALAAAACTTAGAQANELQVFAAGSLRAALGDVAKAYAAQPDSVPVRFTFGASGLLKDRLAGGERADVFASANTAHPQALADAGRAAAPKVFARNRLCALAAATLDATPETLVERLLDPAVRLGTSTPKADPAGDYTWAMFDRIEQQGRPGAAAALAAKALQLTGGPSSPPPPADRNVYGWLMGEGRADLFITYCTNAVGAAREVPALRVVELPQAINVAASYGVTVLAGAAPGAPRFVDFLLGPAGQAVLARHGFAAP